MKQIIECVPNISEGQDSEKIQRIANVVKEVDGVNLLDIDPGKSTNRTVITFVGPPQQVIDAAFLLIKKASEEIDMSKHSGEHPRMGATDVCPLIPISGISMDECAEYAKKLGERVGKELNIPVYLYENAAQQPKRKNLAYCRSGEYEGLDKISQAEWTPDFGPNSFSGSVLKSGVTAISARDFLVAYNVNLNTTSTRRANAIAFDIREAGRIKKEGGLTGKVVKDADGNPVRTPGTLKAVKGIGWYIEEYGIAQLSLNLTNISITPVHVAFDEADKKARARGVRVTGSELVGLIPLQAMLDAADYYLTKQSRSLGISESEKIKIAVKSLGLDDLKPFIPEEKIIEYMMDDASSKKKLVDMTIQEFAEETASESPAPGGGSISAYAGAMGVALGGMVANLSANKRGWDDRWETFSKVAEKGQDYLSKLLMLVDEDTNAFNKIMDAVQMPKSNDAEKAERAAALQAATKYAIEVPFEVMKTCYESMEVMKEMAEIGNPNSISDAGVGALCARAGVLGAFMNVKINCGDLEDKEFVADILKKGNDIQDKAIALEKVIIELVEAKL